MLVLFLCFFFPTLLYAFWLVRGSVMADPWIGF